MARPCYVPGHFFTHTNHIHVSTPREVPLTVAGTAEHAWHAVIVEALDREPANADAAAELIVSSLEVAGATEDGRPTFALRPPTPANEPTRAALSRGQLISRVFGLSRKLWDVDAVRANNLASSLRQIGIGAPASSATDCYRVVHELEVDELAHLVEKLEYLDAAVERAQAQAARA